VIRSTPQLTPSPQTNVQNKADLNALTLRLHQLTCHILNAPIARDPLEKSRRNVLIRYATVDACFHLPDAGVAHQCIARDLRPTDKVA
jgi:hypothetical protein